MTQETFKLLRAKHKLPLELLKVIPLIITQTSGQTEYQPPKECAQSGHHPNHTKLSLLIKAWASSLPPNLSTNSVMDQNVVSINKEKLYLQNSFLWSQPRNISLGGGKKNTARF